MTSPTNVTSSPARSRSALLLGSASDDDQPLAGKIREGLDYGVDVLVRQESRDA